MKVVAIDPPGCGCTECLTGEYAPLDEATPQQLAAMLCGDLRNNTARKLSVAVTYEIGDDEHLGDYGNHAREVIVTIVDPAEREEHLRWVLEPEALWKVM